MVPAEPGPPNDGSPGAEGEQFGEELEKYRRYLWLLARVQLDPAIRGRVSPSDIVQQTLIEAYSGRDQFEGVEEQRAGWLRQILARNLADAARDHRRAKRDIARERSIEASLGQTSQRLGDWIAQSQTSPSQHVAREEELLQLVDALFELDEEELEVVVRRHWQGETLAAIGEAMNLSKYLVTQRYRNAITRVRKRLS